MRNFLLFGFILLLTSACSSLSEKECQNGNWEQYGVRDGQRGYGERLSSHIEACGEYGISPDESLYKQGYREGNLRYCKETGKKKGEAGDEKGRPSVCSSSEEYDFAFKEGLLTYCHNQGMEYGSNAKEEKSIHHCRRGKYRKEFKLGFTHGLKNYCSHENGEKLGRVAANKKDYLCSDKLKVKFLMGYRDGIDHYCRRVNGFNIAKNGGKFKPSKCPRSSRKDFQRAYDKGKEHKSLTKKISVLKKELKKLMREANKPDASPDLQSYLDKQIKKKMKKKRKLELAKAKIEGFIGI